MKKIIQSLFVGTTGLTLAILIGNRPANALTFVLSQLGWEGNGQVTGVFSAEDKNGNNIIEYNLAMGQEEVFAYEMSFSGNSNFDNFTHTLDNLENLVYNLSDNTGRITSIGDSNYISIGFNNLGFIGQNNDSIRSNQEVIIMQVSESTSWIVLVLFAFGAYFKRAQKY